MRFAVSIFTEEGPSKCIKCKGYNAYPDTLMFVIIRGSKNKITTTEGKIVFFKLILLLKIQKKYDTISKGKAVNLNVKAPSDKVRGTSLLFIILSLHSLFCASTMIDHGTRQPKIITGKSGVGETNIRHLMIIGKRIKEVKDTNQSPDPLFLPSRQKIRDAQIEKCNINMSKANPPAVEPTRPSKREKFTIAGRVYQEEVCPKPLMMSASPSTEPNFESHLIIPQ